MSDGKKWSTSPKKNATRKIASGRASRVPSNGRKSLSRSEAIRAAAEGHRARGASRIDVHLVLVDEERQLGARRAVGAKARLGEDVRLGQQIERQARVLVAERRGRDELGQ